MSNHKPILIVARSDGQQKAGGDINLLHAFQREIAAEMPCELVYGLPSAAVLADARAVICTNLDRPVEAAVTQERCQTAGCSFILYTLHHPHAGIVAYLKHGLSGPKAVLATLARCDPQRYEALLWMTRRVVTALRRRQILPYRSMDDAQKKLINGADAVVVCDPQEIPIIANDIGTTPAKAYIVPHPTDFDPAPETAPTPKLIVVAGRIEARKNQRLAAEIAAAMPDLDFLFVGDPSPSETGYGQLVLGRIAELPNCTHQTGLAKDAFYALLNRAHLVLNPSFFEVTSLIDLYCVKNNIPLVTTQHSYLRADGCFGRFDPTDASAGVAAVRDCLAQITAIGRRVTMRTDPNAVTMRDVIGLVA